MATITGSTNSSVWTFKIETSEGTYSVANNTSPLTVNVYIGRVSSSGSYMYGADISGSVTCTGCTAQSFTYKKTGRVDVAAGGWLKIGTVTFSAVPHNSDGSKTVYVSASFSQSGVSPSSGSAAGNVKLTPIPRAATITSAPDFTDKQNPTITYSNPAGSAVDKLRVCISFTGSTDNIAYRDISKTGSSYTFSLTDAERNILLDGTTSGSTSRTVYFYIATTIGGVGYLKSSSAKTFTVTDCKPTLSPTVTTDTTTDIGAKSFELTGDPNTIISGYNSVYVTTGASAKKRASITKQSITNGTTVINAASGMFTNTTSPLIAISATDNRGQTVSVTKTISDFVNYVKLTCGMNITAPDADGDLTFTITGNYFDGNFGAVDNNLSVEYRYKNANGVYPTDENGDDIWTVLTPTVSNDQYVATVSLSGLDYQSAYTFQARASDKIYSNYVYTPERTIKTTPVFDWGENDFNFNVPVTIQGNLVADFIIERGTEEFWHYEKWASGKAVCYGKKNFGSVATKAWGSGEYLQSTSGLSVNFVSGLFIENPQYIGIEMLYGGAGGWISRGDTAPTKDGIGGICVCRNQNYAHYTNLTLGFYVVGKWK